MEVDRRRFLGWMGAALGAAVFGLKTGSLKAEEAAVIPPTFDVDVLMYHEIGARKLTFDILQMINTGSQPISAETFVKAFSGEVILPPGQRLFFLTLDDGLLSQYRAVLDATQSIVDTKGIFVPATFFTITKFNNPDRPIEEISGSTPCYNDNRHSYMSRDQLVDLIGRGHWVDNHTVNHANLTTLELGARNSEVEIGRQRTNSLWKLAGIDKHYDLLAYPYGALNTSLTAYLGSLDYNLAFSERRVNRHLLSERLYLGRIGMSA